MKEKQINLKFEKRTKNFAQFREATDGGIFSAYIPLADFPTGVIPKAIDITIQL